MLHPLLSRFVDARCIRVPSGFYSLKDFVADFVGQLPPKARESWRRSRLVAELTAAGFAVAVDPRSRTYAIAGLAPRAEYQVDQSGRLELVAHA
jgi:hypothetical protein